MEIPDDAVGEPSPHLVERGTAFGHRVLSREPLVRLGAGEPAPLGLITVQVASGDPVVQRGDDATVDLTTPLPQRLGDGVVRLAAPGITSFDLDPDASLITVTVAPGDTIWRHRLLNAAIPLLLTAQGHFLAHASAIVVDGVAVLFIGPSRRGKSTVAATAAELGWPVLAEDGVLMALGDDGRVDPGVDAAAVPVAWPGAIDVRLFDRLVMPEETRVPPKRTRPLPATLRHREPTPVGAVVVLGVRGGEPAFEELATHYRVAAILANSFSVDEATREVQFPLAAALAARIPVVRAHLPEGLEHLPGALRALVERTCETVVSQ
jgi:hypothetical protein